MNLYVRSQDRKRLISNPNFYVVWSKESNVAYIGDITVGHIAKYKTEERALEVLDEIQNIMINNQYGYKVNGFGEKVDAIPNLIYVYKMPKEW